MTRARTKQPTVTSSFVALLALLVFFVVFLSAVNAVTAPRIAAFERAQKEREAQQALAARVLRPLFPEATGFVKLGATTFHDSVADYYRIEKGPVLAGYAIHAFGKGYQSVIHAIVGVNPDFSIRSIRVIHQAETEGLGARMLEDSFLREFTGKDPHRLHVITKGDTADAVMAITAATISSRALTEDAIKTAILFLEQRIKNNVVTDVP